jgi:hypothetical protein
MTIANQEPVADRWYEYLTRPAVRARMVEYLGGGSLGEATACYVTSPMPLPDRAAPVHPPAALWDLVEREHEVARSLWDRTSLVVHLDLEHVSFDDPWAPLTQLERSVSLQQPVVQALLSLLADHGIAPLHLLTGRGHHLVWRIERESHAFHSLAALGRLDDEQRGLYLTPRQPCGEVVGANLGAAYHGLGKVVEHLGHRLLERIEEVSSVSVQLCAVVVGQGPHGREIVSVDLSQFGDPLWSRSARVPFSLYRKAQRLGAPDEVAARTMITVPVADDLAAAFAARSDLDLAAELASTCSTAIPEASRGTEGLIECYRDSALAAFHAEFEGIEPDSPELWTETYDRLDLVSLPGCVRRILEQPNDLLLRPACIQLVVRTLLARGWHPTHVAGLIRSKYARDHGWIRGLHFEEPRVRADFYTRLFAGLLAAGHDRLIDLNCVSTQEKGLCTGADCGWDLRTLREPLLDANR